MFIKREESVVLALLSGGSRDREQGLLVSILVTTLAFFLPLGKSHSYPVCNLGINNNIWK